MDLSIRIRLLGLTTVLSIAAMWILTLSLFFVVQAHATPAVPSESSVVTTYGAPVARAVLANGLSAEALSSPAPSISLTTCDTGDLIGAIRTANVSGGGTVSLQAGCTYALAGFDNTDPTYGSNGLPVITGTITIDGNGATITRTNSAPGFRILQVNPGAVLNLNGIVVGGGDVNGPGGGIRNRGTLSITNSTISGNRANANGGGVFNESGTMSVTGSTFSNNLTVTPGNGGGIYNYFGTLDVTNSTFTSNTAPSSLSERTT